MSTRQKTEPKPKFPSIEKRCKYCKCAFQTKPTYNGSQTDFCTPQHRWAFGKEGKLPIGAILTKQEKRMRAIVAEMTAPLKNSIDALALRLNALQSENVMTVHHIKTAPSPAAHSESPRSV